MSTQLRNFMNSERSFPPNLENESRKQKYPQICSETCEHRTCGYHTQENYGKPCQMQWEQYRNENMKPNSKPNPNQDLLRTIEKTVAKAMKPALDRLEAIETQRQPINRSLNGKQTPIRLDAGRNHYD